MSIPRKMMSVSDLFREAKVDHVDCGTLARPTPDEEVVRLNVPMANPKSMQLRDGNDHLICQPALVEPAREGPRAEAVTEGPEAELAHEQYGSIHGFDQRRWKKVSTPFNRSGDYPLTERAEGRDVVVNCAALVRVRASEANVDFGHHWVASTTRAHGGPAY